MKDKRIARIIRYALQSQASTCCKGYSDKASRVLAKDALYRTLPRLFWVYIN